MKVSPEDMPVQTSANHAGFNQTSAGVNVSASSIRDIAMTNLKDRATREARAHVMLHGANVMQSFRETLFDACNRAGITPNEFALQAAAEKLKSQGKTFSGLFREGDFNDFNGGMGV